MRRILMASVAVLAMAGTANAEEWIATHPDRHNILEILIDMDSIKRVAKNGISANTHTIIGGKDFGIKKYTFYCNHTARGETDSGFGKAGELFILTPLHGLVPAEIVIYATK